MSLPENRSTKPVGADPLDVYPEDHSHYSKRLLRFVARHREAYDAAYLDGNAQAARNELDRLLREYQTLPPRHDCSCWPNHCSLCMKLHKQGVNAPSAVEIGRSSAVEPPMPMVIMLDINAGYAA